MRRCLPQVIVAAAMSFSVPALADPPRCPQGAWFCGEVDVNVPGAPAPPAPPAVRVRPEVAPEVVLPDEPPPPPVRRRPAPPPAPPPLPSSRQPPPPVVVYQPVPSSPPPQIIVIAPGYGYGYGQYNYPYARPRPPMMSAPPPPAPRWQSEWGINLRVEGVALGHSSGAFNPGLGGVGLSLRYRPVPALRVRPGRRRAAGHGLQRLPAHRDAGLAERDALPEPSEPRAVLPASPAPTCRARTFGPPWPLRSSHRSTAGSTAPRTPTLVARAAAASSSVSRAASRSTWTALASCGRASVVARHSRSSPTRRPARRPTPPPGASSAAASPSGGRHGGLKAPQTPWSRAVGGATAPGLRFRGRYPSG